MMTVLISTYGITLKKLKVKGLLLQIIALPLEVASVFFVNVIAWQITKFLSFLKLSY